MPRSPSDQALEAKFDDLVAGILPRDRAARVIELCWSLDRLPDVAVLPVATQV